MAKSPEEILSLFRKTGALLAGHFLLTSGLHSGHYLQCALVLQYPDLAAELGAQLADLLRPTRPDAVAAPAIGGILVAHEAARALGVRALFTERENGVMRLRRGFSLNPGERILVVEDVMTTGGSTRETIGCIAESGGMVVGVGSLVDRSGGAAAFEVPKASLVRLDLENYQAESCPLCRQGLPLVKPGSRTQPKEVQVDR